MVPLMKLRCLIGLAKLAKTLSIKVLLVAEAIKDVSCQFPLPQIVLNWKNLVFWAWLAIEMDRKKRFAIIVNFME
jgi:hypothetical protein